MPLNSSTWRSGGAALARCPSWERGFLLGCIRRAEREVLETSVYRRCVLSPIGLVDCNDIRASCKSCRWLRRDRRTYVECTVICSPDRTETVRRYRSPRRG